MSKYKFNVASENGELIIREGQAAPVVVAKRINLTGNIAAPADWYSVKETSGYIFDLSQCHVVVNRDDMGILFTSNDEQIEEGGHTITGWLKTATALERFGINNDHRTYTAKSLGDLLKMNSILFAERDENRRIVTALQKFKARVSTEIEQNDDLKGNKLFLFEQSVQTEFDLSFTLKTPVYQGQDVRSFKVEIRFDVRDRAVTYWLESVELKEIMDADRDDIIDQQLQYFNGIAIIEQ